MFTLVRVRRFLGLWSMAPAAIRPHFFGACPKKRCRAAKERRFFYLGGSTIRVSAPASVDGTHLRPTWGGGWWLSERLPSPGANGICYGRFARLVDCAGVTVVISFRSPPKARFFGAPPRFFAQEQRNGVERAAGGRDYYPIKRRTRTCLVDGETKKDAPSGASFLFTWRISLSRG